MATTTTYWSPLRVFASNLVTEKHALLILNCGPSMRGLQDVVRKEWDSFGIHICADGGSNSLYDSLNADDRERLIPEYIIGDLDSARPEVLDFYKKKGTKALVEPDDINTDFAKSMKHIQSLKQYDLVYVVNTMWGRMDQLLGNLCTIFTINDIKTYLLSENSLSFTLNKGSHIIHLGTGLEEGHCGLIPFGAPCKSCTTSGLQWNLDDDRMEVTGLVSSCNIINGEKVTVTCSDSLLFTMSHKLCSAST